MGNVCSLPELFCCSVSRVLWRLLEGLASEEEGKGGRQMQAEKKALLLEGQEVKWCCQG